MSDQEPQKFVSYRADSDHFEVAFFGGPLDGSKIITDVYPDNDLFVHRVSERDYVYKYSEVEVGRFHARLHGYETPKRPDDPKRNVTFLTAVVFAVAATIFAAAWLVLASFK